MSTHTTLQRLAAYESRNVTFIDPDGSWPIVWEKARGVHVWDVEGRRYLDLTAAFGVAAAGHANPRVVRAGQKQMGRLLHAMGDVHPHALKADLARELSRLTFERWGRWGSARERGVLKGKTVFCNSGFEAVEAALKTAMLATKRPGVIVFSGAYHGLGYGALNATHRDYFRAPFRSQLKEFGAFVDFPCASEDAAEARRKLAQVERELRQQFRRGDVGAVLVEPIQVRGGIRVPVPGFLPLLRRLCDRFGAVLVFDEIYTGFGRTGKWFCGEHEGVVPDVVCLGKGLTGGFPLSACVGKSELMDRAWPVSAGEAVHTSTFLGHPVGCAMALAQIQEIKSRGLVRRSAELGKFLVQRLAPVVKELRPGLTGSVRGQGLLVGLELTCDDGSAASEAALSAVKDMLRRGFILLPEGDESSVLGFTPPLTISERQLDQTVHALGEVLREA